jgi:hypothetical protein
MNRTPGGHGPSDELAVFDASGTVGLRLGRTDTDVRIRLERGWRAAVGPGRLGAAVLQAHGRLELARFAGWSREPVSPAPVPPAALDAAQLGRAWQDMREFQLRLTELGATTWTVAGPGRLVSAVLRGSQVVDLDLDPQWQRIASDAELEHHIGHTLGVALGQAAALPERALNGCPDLAAVLAHSSRPSDWPGSCLAGRPGGLR